MDVKEGDFVYPIIDMDYNQTNLTTLTKDNFAVDVGIKNVSINDVTYDNITSYYRLNVTVPSNQEGSKQDFWVNVSYGNVWETDIEIESVWYFAPTTTTSTPPSPGPGPGPGPAPTTAPAPPAKISNFTLDIDLIEILLSPGKTDKKSIKVSNNGETRLNITGRIKNLEQFSFFSGNGTEYSFELDVDETKEVEINFVIPDDQEPGVYPGQIVFTGDSIERTVLVVIEVESEEPLFDVKVEMLPEYKEVYPGGNVMAQLTIYNLGKIGRVDVDVEYGIKDLTGNVTVFEHETLAVETQVSIVKSLETPSTIEPDSYIFYAKVSYKDTIGPGSSMFKVIERPKIPLPLYLILIVILAIILVIISIILTLRKKEEDRKEKEELPEGSIEENTFN